MQYADLNISVKIVDTVAMKVKCKLNVEYNT